MEEPKANEVEKTEEEQVNIVRFEDLKDRPEKEHVFI